MGDSRREVHFIWVSCKLGIDVGHMKRPKHVNHWQAQNSGFYAGPQKWEKFLYHKQVKSGLKQNSRSLPSPLSFAQRTISTYFNKARSVSVQKMRDKAPIASTWLGGWSKVLEKMYIGLVPRSPKITPILLYTIAARTSPLTFACISIVM